MVKIHPNELTIKKINVYEDLTKYNDNVQDNDSSTNESPDLNKTNMNTSLSYSNLTDISQPSLTQLNNEVNHYFVWSILNIVGSIFFVGTW